MASDTEALQFTGNELTSSAWAKERRVARVSFVCRVPFLINATETAERSSGKRCGCDGKAGHSR